MNTSRSNGERSSVPSGQKLARRGALSGESADQFAEVLSDEEQLLEYENLRRYNERSNRFYQRIMFALACSLALVKLYCAVVHYLQPFRVPTHRLMTNATSSALILVGSCCVHLAVLCTVLFVLGSQTSVYAC
jgi:FtsH-binding integral membrane protein